MKGINFWVNFSLKYVPYRLASLTQIGAGLMGIISGNEALGMAFVSSGASTLFESYSPRRNESFSLNDYLRETLVTASSTYAAYQVSKRTQALFPSQVPGDAIMSSGGQALLLNGLNGVAYTMLERIFRHLFTNEALHITKEAEMLAVSFVASMSLPLAQSGGESLFNLTPGSKYLGAHTSAFAAKVATQMLLLKLSLNKTMDKSDLARLIFNASLSHAVITAHQARRTLPLNSKQLLATKSDELQALRVAAGNCQGQNGREPDLKDLSLKAQVIEQTAACFNSSRTRKETNSDGHNCHDLMVAAKELLSKLTHSDLLCLDYYRPALKAFINDGLEFESPPTMALSQARQQLSTVFDKYFGLGYSNIFTSYRDENHAQSKTRKFGDILLAYYLTENKVDNLEEKLRVINMISPKRALSISSLVKALWRMERVSAFVCSLLSRPPQRFSVPLDISVAPRMANALLASFLTKHITGKAGSKSPSSALVVYIPVPAQLLPRAVRAITLPARGVFFVPKRPPIKVTSLFQSSINSQRITKLTPRTFNAITTKGFLAYVQSSDPDLYQALSQSFSQSILNPLTEAVMRELLARYEVKDFTKPNLISTAYRVLVQRKVQSLERVKYQGARLFTQIAPKEIEALCLKQRCEKFIALTTEQNAAPCPLLLTT